MFTIALSDLRGTGVYPPGTVGYDNAMPFRIRRGTAGDANFLASVMLSASRAHLKRAIWDLLIGTDEAGCLQYLSRLAIAEPRSLFHYESFQVAELDGKPAAALSGFDMRAAGWALAGEAMAEVQRDLGWTDADVAASQERVAAVWACFPPDVGADWHIENVATCPEYRGRGLASALVDRALRDGKEQGCLLAQISTYLGNDPALSVYKRCGFRVADEKRCPEVESLLGTAGFVRLLREL